MTTTANIPTSLLNSPTQEKHIRTALMWLKGILSAEFNVKVEYVDFEGEENVLGECVPEERIIYLSYDVQNDWGLHLQTLLHESIHIFQFLGGKFLPYIIGDDIYITTLERMEPLAPWKEFVTEGWEDLYGDNFDQEWLEEVPALFLQDCYYWFRQWYDKSYKNKDKLVA